MRRGGWGSGFGRRGRGSRGDGRRHGTPRAPRASATPPSEVPGSMPRYPALSVAGALRFLDYLGTWAFAMSGTVSAGMAGMDVLGCTVVGLITAVGGGSIRSFLLQSGPCFWLVEQEYLAICAVTSFLTFFAWPAASKAMGASIDGAWMFWADTLGLAAFAVIGAANGLRAGMAWFPCLAGAVVTATGGGIIRDLLCNRPARVLHSHQELYATPAALGAAVFIAAANAKAGGPAAIALGVGTGIVARAAAYFTDARLPTYSGRAEA